MKILKSLLTISFGFFILACGCDDPYYDDPYYFTGMQATAS